MKPVIVCTEYRGVFFGYADSEKIGDDTIVLAKCKMAIYWGTTRGVWELADTGPTDKSKISAEAAAVQLRKVTCVIDVTAAAEGRWRNA